MGVYKGRELPNEAPAKNQEKDIRTRTIGREREKEQCVTLHKNIVLGQVCKKPSIYLFLTFVHSLPI